MIVDRPAVRDTATAPSGAERLEDAARRFDPEALRRLFDQSFTSVHGMLVALLGDRTVAEEVAHKTYVRGLDHLRSDRGQRRGLHSWLARSAILEAARHEPALDAPAGIGARPYDPRRVRTSFWRRPPDQREVLTLRLLAGLDSAQVAAAGGRSLALVRSLQERGLRALSGAQRPAARASEQALDQALDRLLAGAAPDAVTAELPEAAAHASLLEVARALRTLLPDSPDLAAMERVRASVMSEAAEQRATWVHSHQGIAHRPASRRALRPARAIGSAAGLVMLAILGAVLGIVLAGMAVTSEPDSVAYPLRRLAEDGLVMAHRNPASRASLEVDLADQRLREAEAMALQGKAALAVQAVHDRYVELRQAARALIDSSGPHDAAWTAARRKFGADEVASLQQVETQLTADGDGWATQKVRDEVSSFQSDRRFLDQELGPVPGSTTAQPSEPQGPAQPTALP